ncbi:thioredoxin family protein [Paralimibaculum aggregatum]|uniref:Thioredoxin family protein n=1 Tax=Paralimibaculum aggregatum TaxID=3036245 RepID=A0ABQ6LF83_9RHOB|nr:thioredoxin family protein [Limibaculum sp. NKW23]GMG81991.1 thioredoxin family protein [Limibaculum sp. NKW23]
MLRRLAAAALLLTLPLAAAAEEPAPGALHHKDWFAVTFKDMREDLETAAGEGKRLAIIVEQHGCIYCRKLHEEVLSDPEVADYIKANFVVVQLNMFGDEEITDLDGEAMTEREAVRRWAVSFTPTVIFLPETVAEDDVTVAEVEVERMPGAFGKWTTLDMFRWVRLKGYEGDEHFQKFHARHIEELRAAGRL